jgi:hypothetical protein
MFPIEIFAIIISMIDPFTTCLLSCASSTLNKWINKNIPIKVYRFYIKNYMSFEDILPSHISLQYMRAFSSNRTLLSSNPFNSSIPTIYAESLILDGHIDIFLQTTAPYELLYRPNIIKCQNYSIIVKKFIDHFSFYVNDESISHCKIAASIINDNVLLTKLKQQFPDKSRCIIGPEILLSLYGHFDNSKIESVFSEYELDLRAREYCAKVGLNNLVEKYISQNNDTYDFDKIIYNAGVGGNYSLWQHIRKSYSIYNRRYFDLSSAYIRGLIYGDHLDKIIALRNDGHYTVDYIRYSVNFI